MSEDVMRFSCYPFQVRKNPPNLHSKVTVEHDAGNVFHHVATSRALALSMSQLGSSLFGVQDLVQNSPHEDLVSVYITTTPKLGKYLFPLNF